MSIEKKILTAFLRSWLKEKFDELGRKVGFALEGTELTTKETKPVILECLEEAFQQLKKEYLEKWEKEKPTNQIS